MICSRSLRTSVERKHHLSRPAGSARTLTSGLSFFLSGICESRNLTVTWSCHTLLGNPVKARSFRMVLEASISPNGHLNNQKRNPAHLIVIVIDHHKHLWGPGFQPLEELKDQSVLLRVVEYSTGRQISAQPQTKTSIAEASLYLPLTIFPAGFPLLSRAMTLPWACKPCSLPAVLGNESIQLQSLYRSHS